MQSSHLSDGLADLAHANERKRDAALLRATTELFVLDVTHDRDEIHRYEELATHFLPKVSVADRAFVAERLAMCGDAPAAVVRALARDVLDVAAPILRRSPVLAPIDLLSVIAATNVEHHRLVAQRPSLAPDVRRALRLTGDPEVLAHLDAGVASPATEGERAAEAGAADRSAGQYYVSNRLDLWRFLDLDRRARLRLIADIASRPPIPSHPAASSRLDRAFRSILGAAQIVGFARSGQLAAIIGAIAEGLDLPPDLVAAAVNDKSGEPLAVMLKALRLDEIQARQVFLLASPTGRDVQAFFPLSDLYAGMEPTVAETMIAAWRETGGVRAAGHQPHLAPNGERRHQAPAEPNRVTRPDEQVKRA
jgi:uncharacterized protein (DUF2336 family)